MIEKIANLKNMELKTWSLLSAIVADCIYVLNLILRIRKFSKLDETIPDENSEIERGLTEYISSHQSEQILFMIGVLILLLATVLLFVQYIKEKDGFLKFIMTVCLICIITFVTIGVLGSIYLNIDIRIKFFDLFEQIMHLIEGLLMIVLLISLLIPFIVFLTNVDYRWNMLMLVGSAIWFLFGYAIIILGIALIIIEIFVAIFNNSDDNDHVLIEYDKQGNPLKKWIKKD